MISLAQSTDTLKLDFNPVIDEETGEDMGYLVAEVESEVSVGGHFVSNESGRWRVGPGDPTGSCDLSISLEGFRTYVAEMNALLAAAEALEAA